jgi:hypothetical protein
MGLSAVRNKKHLPANKRQGAIIIIETNRRIFFVAVI